MDVSYYVTSKFSKNSYKNIIQIYILLQLQRFVLINYNCNNNNEVKIKNKHQTPFFCYSLSFLVRKISV